MSQTHSKKFHCTYLLHYYPFDTQICKVDLQVEEFVKSNVELLPDNMELLTDTELTQYYLQSWTLDFNDHGDAETHHKIYNYITKIISFRFTLRWAENGNYIQAPTDQRTSDHIPSLPAFAADVLCHLLLQTFLL